MHKVWNYLGPYSPLGPSGGGLLSGLILVGLIYLLFVWRR